MEMKVRPDAVGGVCDTWDSSTYRPSRARRHLYSDHESDDDSNSSLEYTNTFHTQQSRDSYEVQTLHHVNISPVDQSNFHIEARRRIRKQRQRERTERRRSREIVQDSSSEFEQPVSSRSREKSGRSEDRASRKHWSKGPYNSRGTSCSEWDVSEVTTTTRLTKHEFRQKRGEDWEVFTIYPEPSPYHHSKRMDKEKEEKRRRRKSVEWDEISSVCTDKSVQKKKAHSYEQKKSRYWDELSTIHPEKVPKNEYRERISKDYYEPTIPVVTKYDPYLKSGRLKVGMTSTCTKRSKKQEKENVNFTSNINWGELSSIYPERDVGYDWSAIKPADRTPQNLTDISCIPSEDYRPKSIPSVCPTLVTESEWSEGTSTVPDNPNNTLVSSVLLQHGGDPNIRNTDGKTALDLADPSAKAVLTGMYMYRKSMECPLNGKKAAKFHPN